MAVLWHKNQKMSDFLGIAEKSQTFSNSCAQNRHDLLAKIVKHIDGTSGAERGCNTDWTLECLLVEATDIKKIAKTSFWLCKRVFQIQTPDQTNKQIPNLKFKS